MKFNNYLLPVSSGQLSNRNRSKQIVAFALLCACNVVNATPVDIQTVALTTDHVGWGAGVNNSGQVAFSLRGSTTDSVMLHNPPPLPGGLIQYAAFPLSRTAIGLSSAFSTPAINNSGDIAYVVNGGIWINNRQVVKAGDVVPATPANPTVTQTFSSISGSYDLDFSDGGAVSFKAQTSLGDRGLWRVNAESAITKVIAEGEMAPSSGGAQFAQIDDHSMNSNGDLIFSAVLNDVSATKGIWRQTAGGMLERVVIDSVTITSPATGRLPTQEPIRFISQINKLAVDGSGNPIFEATINGLTGVWRMNGSNAAYIPGANGWNLDANAAGQIAFMRGNLFTTLDQGVWASDLYGELHLIARQGQLLEVMVGDLRSIFAVEFEPTGLSDAGQIAFSAFFDDGSSGVFLAAFDYGQQSIPSPGTLVLLLSGLIGIGYRNYKTALFQKARFISMNLTAEKA